MPLPLARTKIAQFIYESTFACWGRGQIKLFQNATNGSKYFANRHTLVKYVTLILRKEKYILGIWGEAELILGIWGAKAKYFQGAKEIIFRGLQRSMYYFRGARKNSPPPPPPPPPPPVGREASLFSTKIIQH